MEAMTDDSGPVSAVPIWVDLATGDPGGSRAFYGALFGWRGEPADPAAGGYAVMQLEGRDVAGIGPSQGPAQPEARWWRRPSTSSGRGGWPSSRIRAGPSSRSGSRWR